MRKIVVLVGASGSGKTSLVKSIEDFVPTLVSHTTRDRRDGERDGVDYHFVSRMKFLWMYLTRGFIEITNYNGNFYGISTKEVEEKMAHYPFVIKVMDRRGLTSMYNKYDGIYQVVGVFLHAPAETLAARMKERGDSPEKIQERMDYMMSEGELLKPLLCQTSIDTSQPFDECRRQLIGSIMR